MSAKDKLPPSPVNFSRIDNDGWLSYLVFGYLSDVYRVGDAKVLELEDLGAVSRHHDCVLLYERFAKAWELECSKPREKRSLWLVLWRTVGWGTVAAGIGFFAIYAALSYGPVLILNELTKYLQNTNNISDSTAWVLVAFMWVILEVGSIFYAHSNAIVSAMGIQFRNTLTIAIYRKALRLSPSARAATSTGQIVNMFSNDTKQLQMFMNFFSNSVIAPLQIVVSIVLIYFQMREATFVGVGYMLLLLPANGILFTTLQALRRKKVRFTDMRVKLMNEILGGIRIIKYYAWELPFRQRVTEVRMDELRMLKRMAYVTAIGFTTIIMAAPTIQPVLIFFVYVKLGNSLDAATAFTTLSLFNLLSMPFAFLPMGLAQYSQSKVSNERMLKFFDSEEQPDYVDTRMGEDDVVVEMKAVKMGWLSEEDLVTQKSAAKDQNKSGGTANQDKSAKDTEAGEQQQLLANESNRSLNTLSDVDFQIKRGKLIAVVGPVGSGKSSLLNGLLGELILKEGSVRVHGSVAYCDQRAWILNATIKDNILFGVPYEKERFDRALHACNLYDDIAILPGGLQTEIGERGINLSGGQKARVALARAVYRDADVYLLDDPLSAVDAHVGQWLFSECLLKELAGKTRILVTHQVHLLSQCDEVIVMIDGKVRAMGSFQDLSNCGDIDVTDIIGAYNNEPAEADPQHMETVQEEAEEEVEQEEPPRKAISSLDITLEASSDPTDVSSNEPEGEGGNQIPPSKAMAELEEKITKIISIEEKREGSVSSETYNYYIRAGGIFFFIAIIVFSTANQALVLLANFWLAHWGTVANDAALRGEPLSSNRNLFYLDQFALLSMCGVAAMIIRSVFIAELRIGTSVVLHEGILRATLDAPVAFFDVTPIGRVLNRFSSDMLTVDEELSQTVQQLSNSSFATLGAIAGIAGATNGTFLVLLIPMIFFYGRMQRFFRKSNTAIARLESVSRSPIYADFSQALNGISTIRAYKDQRRFVEQLEHRVNTNTTAAMMLQVGSQWLAVRLDFFGSTISLFIAIIAVATQKSHFISAGLLALGLTYSFSLTNFLKFAVRISAQLEAQMNSVERIKYYADNIVSEEPDKGKNPDLPEDWPQQGNIVAKDIYMRYRDGPMVVKGVSFQVSGGEKVGIAGRTGSGKSSLMVALFRIQELASGQIFIDGIDCSSVPLQLLRSKLGIIPQDPVMFSASVRFNLDPFNEHTDMEVWDALRSVNMDQHVSSLPGKLEEMVAEGGDNFSVGQRQLICIARALLRRPRILVLDEATASVDKDTDVLVQAMVRERFEGATVLTIAHRLHTIIDYDKIMVLDSGHLVEMDQPSVLLGKDRGTFKALWKRHQSSHGLGSRSTSNTSLSRIGSSASLQDGSGVPKRLLGKMTSAMYFDKKIGFVKPTEEVEERTADEDVTRDV